MPSLRVGRNRRGRRSESPYSTVQGQARRGSHAEDGEVRHCRTGSRSEGLERGPGRSKLQRAAGKNWSRAARRRGWEEEPRSASTIWERHGVIRRPHILLECDCVRNQLMVVYGIVNFPRYISPEIAAAGLAGTQAACADLRSRPAAIFRSSTKRRYSRALASASGRRNR
jgi:hypothetical protein